jgi:transposase-like protein
LHLVLGQISDNGGSEGPNGESFGGTFKKKEISASAIDRHSGKHALIGVLKKRNLGELMKRKPTRPSHLTPEVAAKIVKTVREGNYISTACIAAGISRRTFYNWIDAAEEGKPEHLEFFNALKQAEAEAEIDAVRDMKKGGKRFLPSATLLERRWRDRWGRSDRVATEGQRGPGPVAFTVTLAGGEKISSRGQANGQLVYSHYIPPAPIDVTPPKQPAELPEPSAGQANG